MAKRKLIIHPWQLIDSVRNSTEDTVIVEVAKSNFRRDDVTRLFIN